MNRRKLEFWVVTIVLLFVVFSLVQEVAELLRVEGHNYLFRFNKSLIERNGVRGFLFQNYFYPLLAYYLTVYASFLLINFYVYYKLYLQQKFKQTALVSVLLLVAVVLSFSVTDTWYKPNQGDGFPYYLVNNMVLGLLLFGGIAFYIIIKENSWRYYLRHKEYFLALAPTVKREAQVLGGLWLGILLIFMLNFSIGSSEIRAFWFTMVPFAYFLYALNRYILLPEYERNNSSFWPYFIKLLSNSLILIIPFVLVFGVLLHDLEPEMFFVFWIGQLVVIGFLSSLVYRLSRKQRNQVASLKKELGQTTADLQFLRSQINPHFLFNALNTLYGTALQENSDRTAQGIQMLGDMMRFMLHENHQPKILLAREIEYLRNYINLQSLRVAASPKIHIQTNIEDTMADLLLAPMLLIPFVENAFKHGIRLAQPSWIKIALHHDQHRLYFDVYNSRHVRAEQEQDPEKQASGVGLDNVKQRLSLLYPDQHELIIRETPEEYFVHLTLELERAAENEMNDHLYDLQDASHSR